MFSIYNLTKDGFDIIRLADSETKTQVEVIPACGSLLHSFVIFHNNQFLNIIDNYNNKKEFDIEMEAKGFKSAKLSPFVCRMKDGEYHYGEQNYKVKKFYLGSDAIHGLIYEAPFEIILQEATEEKATLELLHHYKASDAGYPFNYDCRVVYELRKNNSLTISTTIINRSEGMIPISDGWHPYFKFGGTIDDCQLEFQSKEIVEFDERLIPTGKLISYQEFGSLKKIGDTFLDNCFTVNFAECQPMLILRDPVQKIQLEIKPDKSYPYLQIYTPPHRQSIAIENLSSAPDAFNNGMGLISLAPGEECSFFTEYIVRSL